MVVIMKKNASEKEVEAVITNLNAFGFDVHRSSGISQVVLGAIGVRPGFDHRIIRGLAGVADVQRVTEPYKLASRAGRSGSSMIDVDGVKIGGRGITIMVGLRSIESEDHMREAAKRISLSSASLLQGNSLQPCASFYEYHGLKKNSLNQMRQIASECQLKLVMEVNHTKLVQPVSEYANILLVGARNMQNFEMLRELGGVDKPVLLERSFAATIEEWLMSAEYIMRCGNRQVILCERGIRTFEPATRYTLDLSAVSVVKTKSHLPVFVDPCQGTGVQDYVIPLARGAIAIGADGVIIDVHHDPSNASVRGAQSIDFDSFADLMVQVRNVANAVGRDLHG